jgi:hypothetical protein
MHAPSSESRANPLFFSCQKPRANRIDDRHRGRFTNRCVTAQRRPKIAIPAGGRSICDREGHDELDDSSGLPDVFDKVCVAGDPSGCKDGNGASLALDQRGFVRTIDGPDADAVATCDIGAIEAGSFEDLIFRNGFE